MIHHNPSKFFSHSQTLLSVVFQCAGLKSSQLFVIFLQKNFILLLEMGRRLAKMLFLLALCLLVSTIHASGLFFENFFLFQSSLFANLSSLTRRAECKMKLALSVSIAIVRAFQVAAHFKSLSFSKKSAGGGINITCIQLSIYWARWYIWTPWLQNHRRKCISWGVSKHAKRLFPSRDTCQLSTNRPFLSCRIAIPKQQGETGKTGVSGANISRRRWLEESAGDRPTWGVESPYVFVDKRTLWFARWYLSSGETESRRNTWVVQQSAKFQKVFEIQEGSSSGSAWKGSLCSFDVAIEKKLFDRRNMKMLLSIVAAFQ